MRTFRYTKVTGDGFGRSRFADTCLAMTEIDLCPPAAPLDFADIAVAASVGVIGSDEDWHGEAFHTAPARQLLVVLSGGGAITVGAGERRRFGSGDVLLVEDGDGEGHSSRFFGETRVLVVGLG